MNRQTPATAAPSAPVAWAAKLALIGAGLVLSNYDFASRVDYFVSERQWFPLAVFVGIWGATLLALLRLALPPRHAVCRVWAGVVLVSTVLGDLYHQIASERLTLGAAEAIAPPLLEMLHTGEMATVPWLYTPQIGHALLAALLLWAGLRIPVAPVAWFVRRPLEWLPSLPLALTCVLIVLTAAGDGQESRGFPQQFLASGVLTVLALGRPGIASKADVDIPRVRDPEAVHIVLVVDESVRGDFVDLTAAGTTTPYLASRAAEIVDFGLALSGHNCSDTSNAILRLGAKPDTLGDPADDLLAHPSIWKFAREAGFETVLLEGQGIVNTRQNLLNQEELDLVDRVIVVNSEVAPIVERDQALALRLAELLRDPGPRFVFVNKRGAHFPYEASYPEERAFHEPHMSRLEPIGDKPRMENSYRNLVRWVVDGFFEELLPRIDLSRTVLIYTSDHGQNLLDDGQPITHCRQFGPHLYEAVVPLLVFTRDPGLSARFARAAATNRDRASSFQIFPTVLTLMGYAEAPVREAYYLDLFAAEDAPLGFTSGPATGRFGRRPTWHAREGLEALLARPSQPTPP